MTLAPYLHFDGNCEEALNLYKKVLNGTFEVVSRYNDPNMNAPENYKDKVLHAHFSFGDNNIMASDVFPGHEIKFGDAVAMSLGFDNEEETKRVYDALSEGGKILQPLQKQFWGDYFGYFVDRFGVRWMVNASK